MKVAILVAVFVILNAVDFGLTKIFLSRGVSEANPIINFLGLDYVKAIGVVAVMGAVVIVGRRLRWTRILSVANAGLAAVCAWNAWVIWGIL